VLKDCSNVFSSILTGTQTKSIKQTSKAPRHTTTRHQTQQSSTSLLVNKDVVHAMNLHDFKWQNK